MFSIFDHLGLLEQFEIDRQKMLDFLIGLNKLYNKNRNPFHNFTHGISVLHGCFYIVTKNMMVLDNLNPFDILLLFVAAIAHDVDHTGFSNAHEIARKSELAIKYEEESVLEKHHTETLLGLLQEPESAIFSNYEEQWPQITEFIRQVILYTDMKRHNELI